jgi:hypothetical protein
MGSKNQCKNQWKKQWGHPLAASGQEGEVNPERFRPKTIMQITKARLLFLWVVLIR